MAPANYSRRELLQRSGLGFGSLALAWLLGREGLLASEPGGATSSGLAGAHPAGNNKQSPWHFPPRAKAIIQLMHNGGPSQMDLLDPKPELQKRGGQKSPIAVEKFLDNNTDVLLASPFQFFARGECGMQVSELLPEMARLADEMCLVRSMYTEHNNHTEATVMINTGKTSIGRPSLGSWISYALGTENHNLPAFVVLRDPDKYDTAGSLSWSAGWLPATHQGTEFSSRGTPVPNLHPSRPVNEAARRAGLYYLAKMNAAHRERFPLDTELDARIRNYELAARMQLAAGEVLDLSRETASTKQRYGLNDPHTAKYGARCLMARRLIETGVPFVQVFPDQDGQVWDHHNKLPAELPKVCQQTDRANAALIEDLRERGLLDSTIVLWAGEFGRLPTSQNADGRDHNRHAFSILLAGGGFRQGLTFGATDDFGYQAVTDRMSVADLHATLLHQMGLDHNRVTFLHSGRQETLTDSPLTNARVVGEILDEPVQV